MGAAAGRVGPLQFGPLDDLLGFHVRFAHLAMFRDWAATLKECDLTQKQLAVLSLIRTNAGCSQIALGASLGTDRATMMAIIDRLEERDLVVRVRSKIDRRRQELYLTPGGETLLDGAFGLIEQHEARFCALFKPGELETLVDLLQRIYAREAGAAGAS